MISNPFPHYPDFRPIHISDIDYIDQVYKNYKPYCDFFFPNLYIWRPKNVASQVSILNNNLIIKSLNIINYETELSYLGLNKLPETISTLLEEKHNLSLIPEECLPDIENNSKLKITEDVDNDDYIMSLTEIASLEGHKYMNKRNELSKFHRALDNPYIETIEINTTTIDEILALYKLWVSQRDKKVKINQDTEYIALNMLLTEPLIHKNLFLIGIYDKTKLIGFISTYGVHSSYAMGTFSKGNYEYPGINTYLENVVAKILLRKGYVYLNHEQDLGLSSLKNSKNSWRPVSFLKKYKIAYE